jgi:PAS domain S-box-containing protein
VSAVSEERVLVLAPAPEDRELTRVLLPRARIHAEEFPDLLRLSQALEEGAGAVLLTETWESSPGLDRFLELVEGQPAWSELPVVLLMPGAGAHWSDSAVCRLGNVTLLELPVRANTLVTAIQTALRSRRRQYQIREHLRERELAEAALRESEARLRFSLDSGRLGSWEHEVATDQLICSDQCKAHFGRRPEEPLTHEEILQTLHPEDRDRAQERIRGAIRAGEGYILEYRVVWPDGSIHWLMVRGHATYDAMGQPERTFGITLDVTSQKEAEARLAEQAEALREADRRKDEFLAMLAHELRNPLAPMTNAVEILRLQPNNAAAERARQVVERQLNHLGRLVDDLLDVSRINTGKITLKPERLDLVEAVERAVEGVRGFIRECGHTLEVSLPPGSLIAELDPVRLDQVIANLLKNAAKYTERGGHIRVALERDGDSARIRVSDTGIGIAANLLPHVFELFTQGERGLDRAQGGLGLGLTLVRNLVRLHGGTVEAHSDGPGQGSVFEVRFPVFEYRKGTSESLAAASVAEVIRNSQIDNRTSRRVLVVDDNRDSAETLAELARLWGFEIDTAFDGHSALQRASEWEPSCVVLDLGMPGLSGYEVARRLRRDRRFAGATLVALTGYGQAEDRERSRAAGFDHHLVKPVDAAELEALLRAGHGDSGALQA